MAGNRHQINRDSIQSSYISEVTLRKRVSNSVQCDITRQIQRNWLGRNPPSRRSGPLGTNPGHPLPPPSGTFLLRSECKMITGNLFNRIYFSVLADSTHRVFVLSLCFAVSAVHNIKGEQLWCKR